MRLTLHSIERSGPMSARVVFLDEIGDEVETVFTIARSAVGDLATAEPEVFSNCGGTAAEVRSINAAVVAFCAATRWKPEPEP